MWTFLLVVVSGCSGCGAGPEPAPAPVVEPAVVAEPEPELMPEQAVPTHPDLVLGAVQPPPADPLAYAGAMAPADWLLRRTWSSRPGRDWTPGGVQILWVSGTDPLEVEQLKADGETMVAYAGTRLERVGPTFGVTAARQSGQRELAPLDRGELLIAPTGTSFRSPWVGQMVTLEVKGVQQVTVPAGTYDALWVQRTWAQGPRSTVEDTWWTAEKGAVAQVVRVQTEDSAESRMTVLAEFGNVPDPAVLRQVWADGLEAMGLGG